MIVELSPSDSYDSIFVVVDKFLKFTHFILTTTTLTAKRAAKLIYQHI